MAEDGPPDNREVAAVQQVGGGLQERGVGRVLLEEREHAWTLADGRVLGLRAEVDRGLRLAVRPGEDHLQGVDGPPLLGRGLPRNELAGVVDFEFAHAHDVRLHSHEDHGHQGQDAPQFERGRFRHHVAGDEVVPLEQVVQRAPGFVEQPREPLRRELLDGRQRSGLLQAEHHVALAVGEEQQRVQDVGPGEWVHQGAACAGGRREFAGPPGGDPGEPVGGGLSPLTVELALPGLPLRLGRDRGKPAAGARRQPREDTRGVGDRLVRAGTGCLRKAGGGASRAACQREEQGTKRNLEHGTFRGRTPAILPSRPAPVIRKPRSTAVHRRTHRRDGARRRSDVAPEAA